MKKRRAGLGLAQQAAADKAGMPRSQWSDLEADRTSPKLDTLERVCKVLGCTVSEFLDEGRYGKKSSVHYGKKALKRA